MDRRAVNAELRRGRLQAMLEGDGAVSVRDAAAAFGVSAMTVRRDLQLLEASGRAVRRYGGAVPAQRITFEFAFDARRQSALAEKKRIGQAAAARVRPGDVAFLDTGTTTAAVAEALAALGTACGVITSSLVVASILWGRDPIALTLLGGRVRHDSPDLGGAGTEVMLERLSADVAILGCDAADVERGYFAQDEEYARVPARMAGYASRTLIVADGSKLGRAVGVRFLPIDGADELITDSGADPELVDRLRARGVAVSAV